jgi:hypothetical protein
VGLGGPVLDDVAELFGVVVAHGKQCTVEIKITNLSGTLEFID